MSNTQKILDDLAALSADAKEFVGEFVYAPFGIESSPFLNSITLYSVLAVIGFGLYRWSRPVPQTRARHPINEYDFGRNV